MRTIYTDRYGLYLWAMLFAAAAMAIGGYGAFSNGNTTKALLNVLGSGCFVSLAARRLMQVRMAKRKGDDSTILRKVD